MHLQEIYFSLYVVEHLLDWRTSWRKGAAFENLLRRAVSETEDIPRAQAATVKTRKERLEHA